MDEKGVYSSYTHIFRNDIGVNLLGMAAHWVGKEIHFSYPISIYVGEKWDE